MKQKIISPLLLLFAAAGCATAYNLTYADYDQTVDFSKFKTFSWIPHTDSDNTPYHNQIIFNNTINYFSHELATRGMTLDNNNPDVLLELKVTEKKKQKTETIRSTAPTYIQPLALNPYQYRAISPRNPYYTLNPQAYYYNRPLNYNTYTYGYTTRTVEYTEGAITLTMMDIKQNKFVYSATVQADLYDPSTLQRELHPAVHALLENYPVKPPSTARKSKK